MSQSETNRPNRGWRIRGNRARAVIHRSKQPLEITMVIDRQPDGRLVLTLKAEPLQAYYAGGKKAVATFTFAQGEGRIGAIAEMAATLTAHEVAAMLGVNE